jgi:hypothetical protein
MAKDNSWIPGIPGGNLPPNTFTICNRPPSKWIPHWLDDGENGHKLLSLKKVQAYQARCFLDGKLKTRDLEHRIVYITPLSSLFGGSAWEYVITLKVFHSGCETCQCTLQIAKGMAPSPDAAKVLVDAHLEMIKWGASCRLII